jgi:hypothetical protein
VLQKFTELETRSQEITTVVDVQTLLEACFNMSMRCACFIDAAFSGEKQKLPILELLSTHVRLSGFLNYLDAGLKEFYCT